MWVAKIKTAAAKSYLGSFAMKHHITGAGYPLRYWRKKGEIFILVAGYLIGSEQQKRAFIADLRRDGKLSRFEIKGDFLIGVLKGKKYESVMYDHDIIWLKPAFISPEGYELWELGSWEKKPLQRVINMAREHLQGVLLKLVQEKISTVSIMRMLPALTDKQRFAFTLAAKNGYYEYPRQIELKQLAKMMQVSYATYQAHLRKAERALFPWMVASF